MNMMSFEELLKSNADNILKRKTTKKIFSEDKQQLKVEPVWMNYNIKKEIKLRRKYNKEKRNANPSEAQAKEQLYKLQKSKVQQMIKAEITKHERKITEEVKGRKDSNKKMFKMIEKLRGTSRKFKKDIEIYNKDKKIEKGNITTEMIRLSNGIYRKHPNDTRRKEVNGVIRREVTI